jgi:hypothetical protein
MLLLHHRRVFFFGPSVAAFVIARFSAFDARLLLYLRRFLVSMRMYMHDGGSSAKIRARSRTTSAASRLTAPVIVSTLGAAAAAASTNGTW